MLELVSAPSQDAIDEEPPTVAKVIRMRNVTKLDLDPDVVLQSAIGQLKTVVIMGFGIDGNEYFASSCADGGDVLWHLERAKRALLDAVDG